MNSLAPPAGVPGRASRTTPVAAGRFAVECMIDQQTQDLMTYAKSLVGEGLTAQVRHALRHSKQNPDRTFAMSG